MVSGLKLSEKEASFYVGWHINRQEKIKKINFQGVGEKTVSIRS